VGASPRDGPAPSANILESGDEFSMNFAEVEVERRGYLRLAARSKMSDADLDDALDELEETCHVAEEELREVERRRERLEVSGTFSGEGGALCGTETRRTMP
jgi:hypothetical protein